MDIKLKNKTKNSLDNVFIAKVPIQFKNLPIYYISISIR